MVNVNGDIETNPVTEPNEPPPPLAPGVKRGNFRRAASVLVNNRPVLLVVLIVVLCAYMAYRYPYSFPDPGNIQALLLNAAQSGILVVGMMLLMIGGAFDLSIGSILALAGVTSALLITKVGVPPWLAVLGGLAVGAASGLVNGIIVTRIRINALIATLAMAGVLRGITQLISGTGVGVISDDFAKIGQSTWLGLQSPFWVMLLVAVVFGVLVAKTRFFRQYYFVGSNSRAARLSGMNGDRLMLIAFVIMGVLAGLAGVLGAARLNAAVVTAGTGVELQVITAAVLGGATLRGGEGTILGGVLGVVFIAIVNNSLIIIGVDAFWQQIVVGIVLLLAVSLDRWKSSSR